MGLGDSRRPAESGQALTEYLLLISFIVTGFLFVMKGLGRANVMGLLMKPLQESFAAAYQHGHPKAKGIGDGQEPTLHPRADDPGNFRIFLNPGGSN